MKKTSHTNSFRTLFINSCGKVKATYDQNHPTCSEITSSEERKKNPRIQELFDSN